MKANITREKALLWTAQGLTILVVLVAALGAMQYRKVDELDARQQARAERGFGLLDTSTPEEETYAQAECRNRVDRL